MGTLHKFGLPVFCIPPQYEIDRVQTHKKTLRNVLSPLCKYFYGIHLCRLLKITFDLFLQYRGTIKAGSRHYSPLYIIATEKIRFS